MKTIVVFVVTVSVAFASTDPECANYEHYQYGCQGQCISTSSCPGSKYISNLCPSQPYSVKCCFTADSDSECATYNHPTYGQVGHCIETSQCPGSNYISNLCPTKPAGVKCCFSKPTGTCTAADFQYCAGSVPESCLRCICEVESNCRMPSPVCHWDVNSDSCGPYQIKSDYWSDATLKGGTLMGSWLTCTADWECSCNAVQGYMARYATYSRLGRTPTCSDFARIHNGGPNGYKYSSTDEYWNRVNECLSR